MSKASLFWCCFLDSGVWKCFRVWGGWDEDRQAYKDKCIVWKSSGIWWLHASLGVPDHTSDKISELGSRAWKSPNLKWIKLFHFLFHLLWDCPVSWIEVLPIPVQEEKQSKSRLFMQRLVVLESGTEEGVKLCCQKERMEPSLFHFGNRNS